MAEDPTDDELSAQQQEFKKQAHDALRPAIAAASSGRLAGLGLIVITTDPVNPISISCIGDLVRLEVSAMELHNLCHRMIFPHATSIQKPTNPKDIQ